MAYTGSVWKKWDLHVHTPLSIQQLYGGDTQDAWEKYVTELENLQVPYDVIGVNDYFTIEGFKKLVEFQKQGRLPNITLFPVIELRVKAFGNISPNDAWRRVNLHVIFDNQQDIEAIESQFLNLLPFDYSSFKRNGLTKNNIIDFGQSIIDSTILEKRNSKGALETGFDNLNFDHRQVCELLDKSGLNYLIAVGKTEWELLRWDGSTAEKKDIVERSNIMFIAATDVVSYQKSKNSLIKQNIDIPLLDCSDAHAFSTQVDKNKQFLKDRLGNCNNWIKADPTFEGLKQVIFETDCRLAISEHAPLLPPRRIHALKLNLPTDTMLQERGSNDIQTATEFCLRGEKHIHFSPFFTCLIGGRGAGKSTLLNLIAKILHQDSSFFDANELRAALGTEKMQEIKEFDAYVSIEGTKEIEYIRQNQVEEFAQQKEKLTLAIYTRLAQMALTDFKETEDIIEKNVRLINAQLKDVNAIYEKRKELQLKESKLANDENIVNSFSDEFYKNLKVQMKKVGDNIAKTEQARVDFFKLKDEISSLIEQYQLNSPENEVESATKQLTDHLQASQSISFDKNGVEQNIVILKLEQKKLLSQLEQYLKSKGLSKENISDYERAAKSIPNHQRDIQKLKVDIQSIERSLKRFDEEQKRFDQDRKQLEQLIQDNLAPLNSNLKSDNPNVKNIHFQYEFDEEKARIGIFEDFWAAFAAKRPKDFGLNSPQDAIRRYLFENDPKKVLKKSRAEFVGLYELKNKSSKDEVQAKQYLSKLFDEEVHFEMYKLIVLKALVDPNKYKLITGFYDNRALKNCSFGQRCTAVIVALLTFGNKPLIIDEPEAHLDSKLIAEYLVELVKKRKQERQIIFATHNANFVVNGDAELILHLETDENHQTIITPVSIENIDHREKLLLLEGGEEAFRKRDKRLMKK